MRVHAQKLIKKLVAHFRTRLVKSGGNVKSSQKNGKIIELKVEACNTIEQVKQKIQYKESIPSAQQTSYF